MGSYAPTSRTKASNQGRKSNVCSHQAITTADSSKKEICGAEHTNPININHLMVNDVVNKFHLVVTTREIAKVDLRRTQDNTALFKFADLVG
jgi:hypothetical protein